MKTIKFFVGALFMVLTCISFVACSDDDPKPDTDEPTLEDAHFDVWATIGKTSGMGSNDPIVVKNVKSLEGTDVVDFDNNGVDVTAKLFQESIIKGKYYYQLPKEGDRFGKYRITGNSIVTEKEFSFEKNTLKIRSYSHAWLDDKTLVLVAANGTADQVIWIKVDAENMKILSEGTLALPEPPEGYQFTTSGLTSYRKEDNKIIYSFYYKKGTRGKGTSFYVSFINPSDMAVEKTVHEERAEMMAGSAYGELLQNKTFFDKEGNYYIACNSQLPGNTNSTAQFGRLLRIKKGTTVMDASYEGYNYDQGKIVTVDLMGNNKVLLYIQDPLHCGLAADNWGDVFNCYYAILDLATDKVEEIKYNGSVLPYSSGTFSQRSIIIGNKAYIGVNPEEGAPCVYIYDITTGNVTKGMSIKEGFEFSRLVSLED